MSAVARLVYTYFTSTRLACVLSGGGILLFAVSLIAVFGTPQPEDMVVFALAGQIAFFLGSSNMPLLAGRLSQGHAARLLPQGRLKLLLSMMVTVALVALPALLLMPFAVIAGTIKVGVAVDVARLATDPNLRSFVIDMALMIYASLCILAGWLYLAMWFVTSQRNSAGFSKALVIIVILMLAPVQEINDPSSDAWTSLLQLAIAWIVFGAIFLAWPRLKNWRTRSWIPGLFPRARAARSAGKEIDLMLGTHNPWMYIGALLVPVFLATRIGQFSPAVWLYMLTIFSAVNGAISGQAAERSRALWLRAGWSRSELFARVEASFARHNTFVLGVLLVLMVGIGSYEGHPVGMLAAGLPLLLLGTATSTYLGLMLTRGVRWSEALLAIALMLTLMALPLMFDTRVPNMTAVVALEVILAIVAIVLRFVARSRWASIDWTECRRPRDARLASG